MGKPDTYYGDNVFLQPNVVYSVDSETSGKIKIGGLRDDKKRIELISPTLDDKLARFSGGLLRKHDAKFLESKPDITEDDSATVEGFEEPELAAHITRYFKPYGPFLHLRSKGYSADKKMNRVIRVATAFLLNPAVLHPDNTAFLKFRFRDGRIFTATWDAKDEWFRIKRGQIVPLYYPGSNSWDVNSEG